MTSVGLVAFAECICMVGGCVSTTHLFILSFVWQAKTFRRGEPQVKLKCQPETATALKCYTDNQSNPLACWKMVAASSLSRAHSLTFTHTLSLALSLSLSRVCVCVSYIYHIYTHTSIHAIYTISMSYVCVT
jgi:hypothetical protein